jgi:hypothetical protein
LSSAATMPIKTSPAPPVASWGSASPLMIAPVRRRDDGSLGNCSSLGMGIFLDYRPRLAGSLWARRKSNRAHFRKSHLRVAWVARRKTKSRVDASNLNRLRSTAARVRAKLGQQDVRLQGQLRRLGGRWPK